MIRFAPTIFLGALLLFGVQPMIARFITPWFGGGAAVWTTSLVFFQTGLLGGYAYAHAIRRFLSPRRQAILHLVVLAGTFAFLPIIPSAPADPTDGPTVGILWLLLVTVGGPYLALSSTGPLMQHWFALLKPDASPYRLYALSNLGSLLGLMSYPFLIEPLLGLQTQTIFWSVLYGAYALSAVACAMPLLEKGTRESPVLLPSDPPPLGVRAMWLLLPACGSLVLLATTNQINQDVASVPFLWVFPLALYLVTFIIAFDRDRWYHRGFWIPALVVSILVSFVILEAGAGADILLQVASYCATLFTCCMVCHGELVRLRPPPDRLTGFYLFVSLGGAIGGSFVALVAPLIFTGYWEYQIGLIMTVSLLGLVAIPWTQPTSRKLYRRLAVGGWAASVVFLGFMLLSTVDQALAMSIHSSRNFYGILRVEEWSADEDDWGRLLKHGQIRHGGQFMHEDRRHFPTTYFGPKSGAGLALRLHEKGESTDFRVGIIGLGVGTLASYGRAGQTYTFYEINPAVERLAREYFTYLDDSEASVNVVEGDARIVLERELAEGRPGNYDVLAVDAFSSDAIPVHLLTVGAFELYRAHLAPGGILALHVSNRHLALGAVVRGIAAEMGIEARRVHSSSDDDSGLHQAVWILMTDNEAFLENEEVVSEVDDWLEGYEPVVWTDDRVSVLGLLK